MAIENLIKGFTIIGSALGVVAFLQNITKEIVSTNKEKWKKLTEIISPSDFDNFQYQISNKRRISGKLINKIEDLLYQITKDNQDVVGFKTVFKNKFRKKLLHLKNLYENLREYIQVPYWTPFEDKSEYETTSGYQFNKEVFFEKANKTGIQDDVENSTKEYARHLQEAGNIALEMEETFMQIQRLANKEPFEFILPWKWSFK